MKIIVNVNKDIQETEVQINCKELTNDVESIINNLRFMNQQLVVIGDKENHLIDVSEISYIESLERKTFVYTNEGVYESRLKLYEMESRLCNYGFVRVSKFCLVNLIYVKSIRNDLERRLRLTLKKGEQIIVSRQYADDIKLKLNV